MMTYIKHKNIYSDDQVLIVTKPLRGADVTFIEFHNYPCPLLYFLM